MPPTTVEITRAMNDAQSLGINEPVQIIGAPGDGTKVSFRAMTLDDIDDNCPICEANRKQILAGNPPKVMFYK